MSREKLITLNKGVKKSTWVEDAKFRLANRKWLNYSHEIAKRILTEIKEKNLNQNKLAMAMGISAQHISQIVKGRENLTLESIAKLSTILEVELISFPRYKYSSVALIANLNNNTVFNSAVTSSAIPDGDNSLQYTLVIKADATRVSIINKAA